MRYREWAELSRDDQMATVSVPNLGHALTHIRRAIPEPHSPRPPELTQAWRAIDNSADNGGVSDADGYITDVRELSDHFAELRDADYSKAIERCEWAIELAGEWRRRHQSSTHPRKLREEGGSRPTDDAAAQG